MTTSVLQPGVTALNEVFLMGTQLNLNVRDAITTATFDAGVDRVSQLELEFSDPDFRILGSGIIAAGMRTSFVGYDLEVSAIETGGSSNIETVNIKCRPLMFRRLDSRRGAKVMRNASPSEFIIDECKAIGASYVVQPSPRRNQVARDVPAKGSTEGTHPPSSWTTFQRLANELNYLLFEAQNTLYFGQASWLVANVATVLAVGFKTGPEAYRTLDVPSCRQSLDDPTGTTTRFNLPISRAAESVVGRGFDLTGVPTFNARYMIDTVSCDLLSPTAQVTVEGRRTGDFVQVVESGVRKNTKSAEDFVYWAMQQMGDRYEFGVQVQPTDPDPVAFDAAQLVAWAAYQVGIVLPGDANEQIDYCIAQSGEITVDQAITTRGALLWSNGHIAISLGNGKTVEDLASKMAVVSESAFDRFTKAAKVPGLLYGR